MKKFIPTKTKTKTATLNAKLNHNLSNFTDRQKMKKFFSIENKAALESFKELASLENQVKDLRLQDKQGKRNCQFHLKKVFELVTDSIVGVFREVEKHKRETLRRVIKQLPV